jgi:glycogen operon protein
VILKARSGKEELSDWVKTEGSSFPLGATWIEEEESYNFALYSEHATGLTLLLYSDREAAVPVYRHELNYLKNKTADVWHCRIAVADMPDARYYAYQVEGPLDPDMGHRFDPQKALLDPYAKAVWFPKAFSREAARRPGSNAGKAPLGIIPPRRGLPDWNDDRRPNHTHDTIIYELHVKGFTARPNSGVTPDRRGTYAGLIEKIPYLKELGITVVELLPVHQYDPQEGNYWVYMTLNFFSPHQSYSSDKAPGAQIDEFRAMVNELHKAGIEVVLDVVYNHTTELDENGFTYSFRGIDNSSYYLLAEDRRRYRDDTGTGNVLAFCLHGTSQNDTDIYVLINAYSMDLHFLIQEGRPGEWQRIVDTSLPSPEDFSERGREPVLGSLAYVVKARSIVVLIRKI